jgi:hypothetical protein
VRQRACATDSNRETVRASGTPAGVPAHERGGSPIRGFGCKSCPPRAGSAGSVSRFPLALIALAGTLFSQVDDAGQRSKLPEYVIIDAATPLEQTPANGLPTAESLVTWAVSHGDAFADRYSALSQILIKSGLFVQPRWGLPDDAAMAVASLARGDMPYSTGQVINVDGGMTIPRL